MLPLIVSLLLTTLPLNHCFHIRHHFTDEAIADTFKVSKDKYHVVEIAHTLHKREANPQIQLNAFNQDFKLYLEKNNDLIGSNTPIYLAYKNTSRPSGVHYVKISHGLNINIFHDLNHKAAIMVHRNEENEIEFHGIIGNHTMIRPLTPTLKNKTGANWSSLQNDKNYEYQKTQHVVMKLPEERNNGKYKVSNVDETFRTLNLRKGYRSKRDVNNVVTEIYPEILVTLDYEAFLACGKNVKEIVKYLAIFWNGVDLRYRAVNDPIIRLNVAGIIIPQEPNLFPFLEASVPDTNIMLDSESLDLMAKFLYKEDYFPRSSYDIVVALTKLDLVSKSDTGTDKSTVGIAYMASACTVSNRTQKYDAVALVEDNGFFSGVLSAAHELAHLLGAPHDGQPSSIPELPGAENCSFDLGYLMSYKRTNENTYMWSSCTLENFKSFVALPKAKCLRNKPNVTGQYPKVLPGSILTLEQQCESRFPGTKPCFESDVTVCHKLFCYDPTINKCRSLAPALEGSSCKNNEGICLNGSCVIPPEDFDKV